MTVKNLHRYYAIYLSYMAPRARFVRRQSAPSV